VITPLGDKVVLKFDKQPTGMVGGLHMPEIGAMSCKTSLKCEVLAVGKDCEDVKPGDKVHLSIYDKRAAGTEIEVDGEKYILIRERDINGKYS
jgi:chaperonin GroES